jgi:hypothetical protein
MQPTGKRKNSLRRLRRNRRFFRWDLVEKNDLVLLRIDPRFFAQQLGTFFIVENKQHGIAAAGEFSRVAGILYAVEKLPVKFEEIILLDHEIRVVHIGNGPEAREYLCGFKSRFVFFEFGCRAAGKQDPNSERQKSHLIKFIFFNQFVRWNPEQLTEFTDQCKPQRVRAEIPVMRNLY